MLDWILGILDNEEKKRKSKLEAKRNEIHSARRISSSAMHLFADLSSSFHRDEVVGGGHNEKHLKACAIIIKSLHDINHIASEMEDAFAPEPKKRVSFFPIKGSKEEIIDVCPE